MRSALLRSFKETLTRIGARTPDSALHGLQMVVNYMKLGRWMSRRGFEAEGRVRDRAEVLAKVAATLQHR